jgi:hypothetical protein
MIDRGDLATAESQLNYLARQRHAEILVKTVAQNTLAFLPGFGYQISGASAQAATAGLMAAPMAAPTAAAATRGPVVVNVNASVIGDPSAVAQAVTAALTRYNG